MREVIQDVITVHHLGSKKQKTKRAQTRCQNQLWEAELEP